MLKSIVTSLCLCAVFVMLPSLGAKETAADKREPIPKEPGEMKITQGNDYSMFSTFGTSPENFSRTRIAYTRFPKAPKKRAKIFAAEIWLCDIDGTNHKQLTDVTNIDSHNGARVDWIDDDTIVYLDNFQAKVRNTDGTLRFVKKGYPGEQVFGDKLLVFQPDRKSDSEGIWILNVRSGEYTQLVSYGDLKAFEKLFGGFKTWRITHPRFCPKGKKVAFVVEARKGGFLMTINSDGSGLDASFGRKPSHWLWYDSSSIVGLDAHVDDGKPNNFTTRRWDLKGSWIEDVAGGGKGGHLGIWREGGLFSAEKWHKNQVTLRWYKKGDLKGNKIFTSPHANATYHQGKTHVNPSFARDGSRVYYAKPTGSNLVQGYCYTIKKIGKDKSSQKPPRKTQGFVEAFGANDEEE